MTEEKRTCGQCIQWLAYYRPETGGCRADVPAWVKTLIGKQEFLLGANSIGPGSTLAEECDLFNPRRKG